MDINLTDEERQVAVKYALRFDKTARQWRFWRWSAIACFVIGSCMLLAIEPFGNSIDSLPKSLLEPIDTNITPTPALNASSIKLLCTIIETRATTLRVEFYFAFQSLIIFGLGLGSLIYARSDWHRDQRDKLIAKLLRCIADSQKPNSQ